MLIKSKASSGQISLLALLLILLNLVCATQGDFQDCYSCSQKDDGSRFICNWGDLLTNKNQIACCTKGSKSRYCWDN